MWRTGAGSEQFDPKEDGAYFDVSAFHLIEMFTLNCSTSVIFSYI